jgi:Fe-S cluster assembly ATPase SufC
MLNYIKPDVVHVMMGGTIVESGALIWHCTSKSMVMTGSGKIRKRDHLRLALIILLETYMSTEKET